MSSDPLQFDVHDMTIVVHRGDGDGWLAEPIGAVGAEVPPNFRIPSWVQADELPHFLATLFDAPAGSGRPFR